MASEAETARRTESIPAWKPVEVDALVDLIDRYDSVGVVDIAGIPSRQLQNMRRDLHGTAELRISRNTLIRRAIEEVDEGVEELLPTIAGQVGLVGTDDNPFGLYRQLEASKTPAPINAGEIVPNDIVIPAGDTGIDPGPFVGELQQVGAAARIDEGSIRVTADSTVATTGDVVSEQLAGVLAELEIEPKEVGLDLQAVYADGVLFEPEELVLDIDAYRADIVAATAAGLHLSINAAYPTARTVGSLVQSADVAAKAIGLAAAIEDPDLVPTLVSQADHHLRQLAARIEDEDALPPALRDRLPDAETAPAETPAADDANEVETTDEDDDAEEVADEDDDDEDESAGADGLGAMFG